MFCTCEIFSFFQKSRKYAQNAMKTAIFSQFFINEKRVFSQFFINEKRVFFIQRISQKCIKKCGFFNARNVDFSDEFHMDFVFLLPMSFNNQLKMTKN